MSPPLPPSGPATRVRLCAGFRRAPPVQPAILSYGPAAAAVVLRDRPRRFQFTRALGSQPPVPVTGHDNAAVSHMVVVNGQLTVAVASTRLWRR